MWGQPSPGHCCGAGESQGHGAWCGTGWGTHHALAAGAPGHEAFAVAVPADGVAGGAARHRAPWVTPARCPTHTHAPPHLRGCHMAPWPMGFIDLPPHPISFHPSPLHSHPSIYIPPSHIPRSPSLHHHPSIPYSSILIPPSTSLHPHPSIIPPPHILPCPSLGPSSRWQPCGSPWLRP